MEKIFVLPIFTSLECTLCTASFIFGKENSNYFSADFTMDSNVFKLRFIVIWCTKITFLRLDIIYWWYFLIINQNNWRMNEWKWKNSFFCQSILKGWRCASQFSICDSSNKKEHSHLLLHQTLLIDFCALQIWLWSSTRKDVSH